MKLLSKIGDFALHALALCMLVAFWLVGGWLVGCAAPAVIIGSLYFVGLDKLGDRLVGLLPDSRIVSTATGVLVILCYRLVSRAWRRKRAIEEEIKPVLEIQIGERSPPGRVQKFFSKDGPPDRLFNRCFGWIENIESDGVRFVVGFVVWAVVALPVGGVAMWLQRAQFRTLALWEAIPVAFLYGSVWIFIALCVLVTIEHVSRRLVRIRTWLARSLPRGVVFRYRRWQLRRMGKKRWTKNIESQTVAGTNAVKLRITLVDGCFKYIAQVIEHRGRYYYRVGGRTIEITKDECDRVVANPRLYYFSTALKLHFRIMKGQGEWEFNREYFLTTSSKPLSATTAQELGTVDCIKDEPVGFVDMRGIPKEDECGRCGKKIKHGNTLCPECGESSSAEGRAGSRWRPQGAGYRAGTR